MIKRARRLRSSERLRKMVRETKIDKDSLVYPIFIIEGENIYEEIKAMPGQYRYSIDKCHIILDKLSKLGINNIMLFGIPKHKDEFATSAYDDNGVVQEAIRYIKNKYEHIYIIADVCMCEYTDHGHCGIVCSHTVDNDKSLKYLSKIALSYAKAGANMLAPSDMMDGRVAFIRESLDKNSYENIPIMAYSAKYASSFYGPFREAADSAPSFGDRKTYQMDYHNIREAIKEIELDIEEGADIVMVKPAMTYLDVVARAREISKVPLAAYSVSGEYSMVKAGAKLGFINEENIIKEMTISAFRAGIDIYITYFAPEIAKYIDERSI